MLYGSPKSTKVLLAEKAVVLFSRYGVDGTTMQDIADALVISKTALYKHYKNKEEIFYFIVQVMGEIVEERLTELAVGEERQKLLYYFTWACKVHENTGAKNCTAKPIKENTLEDAVVRAINRLISDKEQFLAELKETILEVMVDDTNDPIVRIDNEIAELQGEITEALEQMQTGEITAEEYSPLVDGYKRKIDVLNLDKEEILYENGKMRLLEYRVAEVEELLGTGQALETFDKTLFKSLVQRIIVLSQSEIQIDFKCGISVKERL